MASAARIEHALTIVVQTSIIVSIFCFVECTDEFCAKYGHSCWGGHGKRSDTPDAPVLRILLPKTLSSESPQNGITSTSKVQWLLSRLIAGQPVLPLMDKYRVRWSGSPKDKTHVPINKWERYATSADLNEAAEPIRGSINNENERKINSAEDTVRDVNGMPENTAGALLVSPVDEYDKPINNPRGFDILKILSMRNGDAK